MSTTASTHENQTRDLTTEYTQLNNLQQDDSLTELGEEGHCIVKDGFIGCSFGVFTSGGDAQGTK